jgi:hypothetical protein
MNQILYDRTITKTTAVKYTSKNLEQVTVLTFGLSISDPASELAK